MFNNTNRYAPQQGADSELFARFTTFMVKVVTSAKIDYIRRQRHWQWEVLMDELPDLLDESSSPEHWLIASTHEFQFAEDRVFAALSALPAKQRRILELSYIDELSAQEIAAILECPVTHIYSQKFAALKRLREALLDGDEDV